MSDSKRYRITSVLDGNTESIEVDGARLTPEAYDKMRSRFGDNFHVEQMVPLNPGETISPDSEYEVTSMLDGNSESVVVNGSRLTPDVQKKMDERFKGDWSVSKAEPVDVQDSYAVMTGDRTMIWDKERYDRSFESFKAFHPDATAERRLMLSPHYSGLSPEKEYEDLSRRLSHEELSNGDFIREYEGNMKAAGLAAKSGTVLAENPYETYLAENRSRYESVRKDIEDMRMRLHANPVYQERRHSVGNALAAMRSGIRKEMDDYIAAHPDEEAELLRSKISSGIYRQTPIASGLISPQSGSILFRYAREVERYGAAKRLMDDAVKLYNAPSRYGEENGFMNYLKGMGDTFSDIDFWTRGLTGIVDSMSLRPVLQDFQEKFGKADPDTISETDLDGMFSPAEKALLNAFAMNAYVQAERSGDLSLGYQAGQGTAESLGYMAEFILTGGVGNAASVPLKNALSKWLAKGISGMAPGIGKKAVKSAGKTAIGLLTDSFKMASMTGVMPSTYENIASALVEVTEEGKLPEVNRAAWNAGIDSAIENLSEIRGSKALSAFVGKMKKGLTRMVPDEFVRALSDNKVTKFLKAGGYDGLPEEFFEEWYGAGLRAITIDPDALRDFATVDSQIVMAASFIPITVGGGLVSGGRRLYLKKRFDRAQDNLRNALVKNGYSDSQADYMISMVQNTSAQQISDTFTPIINTLGAEKATEGGAKSLLGAVADFARASLEYRTAESMQSVKDSEDRDSMKRDILQQTGGAQFWMDTRLRDGSTLPEVQIAATSDGRRFFVLGQASSEGEIPVMDEGGQKSFLRQDDIVQSSEAMPIDTYLSSRIMELKRDAEAQRLDSERSIQMEDLRKEAVPGKQINIGTEEAPVMATIQPSPGHTADEVIVIVDGETAPRALTWEEFGNYIGRPVSTRTDIEIDEAESAKIEQEQSVHDSELAEETLRIIPDGTEADVISPDIAVTAAEQNMPEEQAETQGYAIPMKSDGTVDENAFWNQNPGQWAIWNDAQRNDGGADTDIYIANAVELLESDITGLESAYARESDMDARHAIRSAIDGKRQRLGELQNLISRRSAERQGVPDSADANIMEQAPVPNDSMPDRDDAPQESEIPTDDKGRPQYHLAPLAASLADIYSQGLTQDEIDGFIDANISELQKELDKTRAKAPKIGTDLQAYRKAKADYEDAVASVQERLDYWNRMKSTVEAVKVQSAAIQYGGSQEEAEVQIGRSLTKEEADALVASMERNAVPAPELELTPENWMAEFGEDGIIDTPIGKVKMGEHQYLKLARQGRNGKLGMIRPTLEMPDVVVETDSEAKTGDTADRASSYVFVRTFIKPDGSRYYYFTSVTVNKDGHEVVVSSQEKKPQRILRLLTDGSVIWRTPKDATTSSAEKQGLDYVQPQNAEAAAKGSGITPQSTSFDSKGSENPEESNTLQPEDESLIDAAVRTAQNRNTDIETTRTGRSAEEAPADTPVGGGSNTGALKVNDGVPLSEFATGVADDVYSKLPDNLKGRVSVRSSSDGNESGQSFIQRYDIDGKPSKVYLISLFGTDITTNPNYFAIEGYNVDNQEQWDEYSRLFDEYKKSHPDVRAFEHDETGALFDRFEDALDFSRFAEERMSDADSRFKRAEEALSGENFTDEEQEIVSKAIADGTYMEAPNGAKTNLSPKQWVQVRTKAFKEWFGDWEKAARIEKLRKSAPVEITGNEIEPSDDLKQYKKNALEYGKKLRGEYTNNDTGITVIFSSGNKNGGLKEVLQHDVSSTAHIQSIAAIPQIIENAIYIDSVENEDKEKKPNVSRYHYYVCGLQIGGTDYTVKAVIAEQNNGDRYYDHKLTAIEKSNLIDRIDEISSSFTEDETAINQSPQSGLSSTGESGETKRSRPAANGEETIFSPVSDIKDKRLLSLLQTNSSKVVDENGEPRVVYHGTDADFTVFDRKMSGRKGDPGLRGKGFYLSSNRRTSESYGDNIIDSFVNIKNPFVPFAYSSVKDISGRLNISENVFDFTPGSDFRVYGNFSGIFSDALKDAGYDGVLYLPRQEIVAFNPNQIKSATDNTGAFSSANDDIRYRRTDDVSEFSGKYNLNESDVADYADAMVRGNLNGAARAFHEIRRKIRLDNDGASLGEFVKIFSPIEKELYAKFGNIDDLRQQYVQRTLDERNAMEAARRRAEEAEEVERVRLQEFRAMDSGQLDMEYMRAVEANDESRMRDLVNEAARRNGYGDVASGYQGVGAWSAPSNPGYASVEERRNALQESGTDINVADIAAGYSSQPDDYFTNLRAYGNDTPYGRESTDAINDAIENLRNGNSPMIKVYRAVPKSVKEGKMRNGDWVTPSRKYAQMHGENRLEGDYRIIEQEVSADQLWWDGNDINEWGYDDGGSYAYRNTRNNRKLNDLITRDDKGNIIPLSKRFNARKSDIRFRFIGEKGAARLDAAEEATTRLDNLHVAREMESAFNDKKSRIEKLRKSVPVEISGEEYIGKYELNRDSAQDYILNHLRGEYEIADTGEKVSLSKVGAKKVTSHSMGNDAHLKSIVAIPDLLKHSIFIEERSNEKANEKYDSYRYYLTGLKIGGVDYTVRITIGVKKGKYYYDHYLTEIEKGNLIEIANSFIPTGDAPLPSYTDIKDKRLLSLLQTNDTENARKIKMATGWERGADGKWRYETPDFTFNEKPVVVDFDGYSLTTLGELLNDKGLFNAYPELEDMMVQYQDLPLGRLGQYSPKGMFPAMITLDRSFMERRENPEWRKRKEEMEQNPIIKAWDEAMEAGDLEAMEQAEAAFKASPLWNEYNELLMGKGDVPRYIKGFSGESELAHEIQHVIQDIEGFARGSSPDNFRNAATSENVIADIVAATDGKLLEEGGFDNTPQGIFNALDKKTTYGTILRDYGNALDAVAEKYGYETIFDLVNDIDKFKSSVQMYRAVSGEVEARNVERRMNLTPEERLLSLATETEDVAREDQIVLMNALGDVSALAGSRQDIAEVNRKFNEQLEQLTEENADNIILRLGLPNSILQGAGIPEREIALYGNKLIKKAKTHGYNISDVRDLPKYLENPIAVFKGSYKDGFAILTTMRINNENALVSIDIRKAEVQDLNLVTSVFDKRSKGIIDWINNGRLLYADKEKVLDYLSSSAPIADATNSQELSSATKIIESFENPKLPAQNQSQDIKEVNRKFNEQLGQQIDGTLAKGHIYQLGMPSDVLLSTGIQDLPIELSSTRLAEKAGLRNHEFDISDVKGLPEALQSPLAVFSYGDKDKAQNVIVEIERDGKNFVVGLHLNQNRRGIDINDIRGIFPKDNAEWLNWISQGKLLYADKVKIQTLIDKQRTNLAEVEYLDLDSIANVLNNFENPKLPARNPMPAVLEAIREDRRIGEDNSHVRQPMDGTLQSMRSAADTAANALGVEVNYISRDEMPRDSNGVQQRYAKGYQRAGSIYLCLENHSSEEDVMMTVMHEAVGHKGLRALVGTQNMDRFCMAVFSAADKKVREDIFALSYKYDMHIGEAVEEYLAGLAEKGEFTQDERSFFRKVVDALMELLDRIGIHFDRPFSVADAKYLLWQSYHALDGNDMFIQARRTALANRLGFLPRQEAEETHASLRMRRAVPDSAATLSAESSYSRAVASAWNRLRETFVDMYAPLESLVKSIEAASGKAASAWENVMQHIYSVGSINQADKQVFQIRFMEPLWNAVKKLADKSDAGFDGIIRYVMLKHGLERNEKFARRDAEAHYRDEHRSITDNLRKGYAKRSAEEKAKVDAEILSADSELARHLSDIESGTDPLYLENRDKDYSGIISMFSEYDWKEGESPERREYESQAEYNRRCAAARRPKYEDLADAEAAAREEIQGVESKAAEESAALWDSMRSATGYILDHQLNAGTISRQTYDHLSGMFEYYVPLRGFAEDTAEDLYEYFNRSSSNDFSPPLAKAKGRRSVADNPFAQLGVMAESAIQQDNKNRAKLAMYYFILGRPGNDAVTVSSPWYVLEGIDSSGRKIWRETVPDFSSVKEGDDSESIGRIISAFDARMEALQKSGQAYRGRRRMDLGDTVVHISGASANEHIVPVMVNGERVNMILNSDPRAAQSLNGLLNIESDDDVISGFAGTITRWMANNFTSRNPEFWISNLQRDLLFSLMNVSIKEDVVYRKAFRRNLLQGFRTVAYTRRFRKDSLGDSQYEKYYREFVENGGVTGYTRLASAEEYLGMMEKYMKRDQEKKVVKVVRGCFDGLRDFSESIENVTRFAAYMTSREQGRPVSRAIMDAKNVSVNFNRKGSGKAISWKESARLTDSKGKRLTVPQRVFVCALSAMAPYARRWVAFFNAAVQSLSLNVSLAKNNPRRYAAWMSGCVALGMLNAMIHALLDDDDDYLDMPEWERRQNLLVGGGGYYMKWNIPQEARPFYALGDILVNWSLGRMKHQNIFFEAIESLGEIAPPVVPTPLQPVWELAMNKDYAGAPIYRDMPWDKDNPAYLRTYRGTNQILIDLSELMNSATGGDYATEGAIGNGWWVNPGVWEHFIDGLTGGTGQFIRRVSNVPFMAWDAAVNGEEWSWHDTPLTNRVFVRNEERSRNSYLNGVYWYYKDISDSIERREKRYRKAHDSAKINSLRSSPEYSIMRIFQKYSDRLEHYDDLIREETDESRRRDILRRKDDYVLRPMVDELVAADI